MNSGCRVMGIRHHGPGSARSVLQALPAFRPDAVLIEGPPDAADVLPLANQLGMKPPVALSVYVPDEPKRAVYYPFAIFSPEWQALIVWPESQHSCPVHGLAPGVPAGDADPPVPASLPESPGGEPEVQLKISPVRQDPLRWVAEVAGYSDSERWWEHMIERRRDSNDLFEAVLELMSGLREEVAQPQDSYQDSVQALREAHMRQTIREVQAEGFERIAVICGAWHAPALTDLSHASDDAQALENLPRVQVQATWVPWTYRRLTYWSGYGAGVESPGYYHDLWSAPSEITTTGWPGSPICCGNKTWTRRPQTSLRPCDWPKRLRRYATIRCPDFAN